MKKTQLKLKRIPFLSWIILPLLGVFIATNYIFGLTRRPTWAIIYDTPPKAEVNFLNPSENSRQFNWNDEPLITFWFDDAWISQYETAFPILREKEYPAALAVPTNAISWDGYMTWAHIKRLTFNNWEVTSHSRSHECDLAKLDKNKLIDELSGSQNDLLEKGYPTSIFVLPCGSINDEVVKITKDYYVALRTTEEGINKIPVDEPYALKLFEVGNTTTPEDAIFWINEAKSQKAWLILMFHKIDASGEEYTTKPEVFKSIVDAVSNSGIKVVLPGQVLNINK